MAINDWPLSERPREKLLAKGPQSLSDAELLAIFLRTGCRGKTALDLARDLIQAFEGLRPLLEAEKERFCQHKGLGPAKYVQLQAILEISKRYLTESLGKQAYFTTSNTVKHYLISELRHREREVFGVIFLNSQHQLIAYEELFHGTINSASVHPREIVKRALDLNAAATILAHNHPSGIAEPSQSDLQVTQVIKDALALVEIKTLDHMIIGNSGVVSFAERGLI